MTDPLLRLRGEFPVTADYAYLNHAAIAPLPRRSAERMAALADTVSRTGDRLWLERNAEAERVRGLAARLLGAREVHEVAFVENTSTGLSFVAQGFDWQTGDNVVGADLEFPSNVYPWMQLAGRGVEYRTVPERDGRIDPDELLSRVDDRTRMLVLSSVQYASGFRSDLARLGAACRERGVLFVVDAIQSLGALAHDVERENIDVLAAASHKWLLGPEGIGVLYVSDRAIDRLRPVRSGWRSMRDQTHWTDLAIDWNDGAKRLESGTLNVYGIAALGGSLEVLLEAGPGAAERRVLALADRAAQGLANLGFSVVSSRRPGETSSIVAASHPRHDPSDLVERLAERNVIVAVRAGRLRISAHFYNTEEEIDRCLGELARIAS
ncbi:MAG TPA: aminotransferase class V-fold PLP-dependent enzyme [Thermoanaerobaculia bacterium]|jgi:selenocysteine lyase/cysteine desulfurase